MRLSIITVNLNNREGLQRTIESVICQTWKDYEWIIIDGGSTDGSKELIEQYQECFAYWCSEPDKGIYNAMNKGVEHAHGDYVNFMNSGDCFHDEMVLEKISKTELYGDILLGQVKCIGTNYIANNRIDNVNLWRVLVGFCQQGAFTKLKLLKKHPFDENLKIVSDWKFWWQTIVFDNTEVQNLGFVVADYDMTGISTDAKFNDLRQLERKMVVKSLFPPLVLNELHNYHADLNIRNLNFLKQNNYCIYVILRKTVSMFYKITVIIQKKLRNG